MSNFGQGVAAVAGAVVGFVVGGPTGAAYGFQLGLLAGSALFPTQLPGVVGPRLEDVDQTAADPGSPVPIVYGTIAVSGAPIWLGPIVEESETDEVGGKGAPEQEVTTYSYRQGIALGICEGPVVGVTRIWENGKLVYDLRAQLADETDDAYLARVESSIEYATTFELYLGTETQEPDPAIEADKGAGNVPAFRGLVYIVYADRLLRDDQARRHPTFKFEVSTNPAQVPVVVFTESGFWEKPSGLVSARVIAIGGGGGGGSGHSCSTVNISIPESGGGGGGGGIRELTISADDLPDAVLVTVGQGGAGGDGIETTGCYPGTNPGVDGGASSFGAFVTANGGTGGGQTGGNGTSGGPGGSGATENGGDGGQGNFNNTSGTSGHGESTTRSAGGGGGGAIIDYFDLFLDGGFGGNTAVLDGGAPGVNCSGSGGCRAGDGRRGGDSELYEGGAGGGGGGAASGWPPNNTYTEGPVRGGAGGSGGSYGGGGGGGGSAAAQRTSVDQSPAVSQGGDGGLGADGIVVVYQSFAESVITLADVVEDLSRRAGLLEIDVEDLRAIPIDGYAVGRPMPARSAIEPLRSFGYFDVVESGATLRFVARGGAAALTLDADALGAHRAGDSIAPAITTRKLQDVELPRQVRVRYLDTGRDYEPGEQLSPVRLTTEAENDIEVDLPIAMSGTRAAQIAEVLWADAWRSRWVHGLTLEGRYLELEPTDVVDVPVDSRIQRMRIISIEDADGGALRKLELVRDGSGAYTSYAVAADPDRRPNVISVLNTSGLILLDLPALRDQDDDAGIYAVAYPTGTGTRWDGAIIYRSADDGGTFASVGTVISAPAVGTLPVGLEDGITSTFDEGPTLVVDLDYGTLESRTEAALLEGANTAAIGTDGNWQLIQFRDVEQITPTRYELRGIIRGRRGTEHETRNSRAGNRFVMVSTGAPIRVALQSAEIGASRIYRAVTLGAPYSSGDLQTFTGRGVALRPFSPIDVSLEDQENGDVRITWIRRNRLSQELRDGVEIPMSEAAELYEVDLFARFDVTVPVRTLSSSSESATYTASQIAEDFGSPLASAETLAAAVFQISNIVGRGIAGYSAPDLFNDPTLDSNLTADADRSFSLDYLEFIKSDYPDSAAIGRTVEFRHRNTTGRYVVDIQQIGAATASIRRFEDGETESSGSAGGLYVNAYAPDYNDTRYFFISQLYGGTTFTGSGPGTVRKIDASALSPGGILSAVTVASNTSVGASGDPWSLVVLGDYVYAACPYSSAIYKLSRSTLAIVSVLVTPFQPWNIATRGSELWAVERARPSPRLWRVDTDSGATLTEYTLTDPYPVDLAIINDWAYLVSSDDAKLVKYSLVSGLRQSFELELPTETFGQLRNYLRLDGVRLSIGRNPTIYVLDTSTDTLIAP